MTNYLFDILDLAMYSKLNHHIHIYSILAPK